MRFGKPAAMNLLSDIRNNPKESRKEWLSGVQELIGGFAKQALQIQIILNSNSGNRINSQ